MNANNVRSAAPAHGSAAVRHRGRRTSRRLYLQIYLTVLASLFLVVICVGAVWHFALEDRLAAPALEMAGEIAAAALPAAEASPEAQREALDRLSGRLKADLALYDARRALVASSIRPGARPLP